MQDIYIAPSLFRQHRLAEEATVYGLKLEATQLALDAWAKGIDNSYDRGLYLLYQGNLAGAEKEFQRARRDFDLKPAEFMADAADIDFFLAKSLEGLGMYREAAHHYQLVVDKCPEDLVAINNLSCALLDAGCYDEAGPVLESAIELVELSHQIHSADAAILRHNLGAYHLLMGNRDAAIVYLDQGFRELEIALGKNHPSYAIAACVRAGQMVSSVDSPMAELLVLDAMDITRSLLGENHPQFAGALGSLALIYDRRWARENRVDGLQHEGLPIVTLPIAQADEANLQSTNTLSDGDRALLLHKEAIAITRRSLGDWHPALADQLRGLAARFHSDGAYEEEKPLLEEAIPIYHAALGDTHPLYAQVLDERAMLMLKSDSNAFGWFDDARTGHPAVALAEEVVAIASQFPESAQIGLVRYLSHLAQAYQANQEPERAEDNYLRAIELRNRTLNAKQPSLDRLLYELANLYELHLRSDLAEDTYRRALDASKTIAGEFTVEYLNYSFHFAWFLEQQNRWDEAEPYFRRCMEIAGKLYRNAMFRHSIYAESYLGVLKRTRKFSAAEDLSNELIEVAREAYGENSELHLYRLRGLAEVFRMEEKYERAESLLLEILRQTSRTLGTTHSDYQLYLQDLVHVYKDAMKLGDAITAEKRLLVVIGERRGTENEDFAAELIRLSDLYKAAGDLQNTQASLEHAIGIFEARLQPDSKRLESARRKYQSLLKEMAKTSDEVH